MHSTFHSRWVIQRDFPALAEIDALSHTPPWTEDDFRDALRQREVIGMVIEPKDKPLGFLIYRLRATHIELLNLAVHPEYRRCGVGACLIRRVNEKLTMHQRTHLAADVRESNTAAQLFLRACGFQATAIFADHFPDGEAAYTMSMPSVPAGVRVPF